MRIFGLQVGYITSNPLLGTGQSSQVPYLSGDMVKMDAHNGTPVPLSWLATIGMVPLFFLVLMDRLPPLWPTSKKASMIGQKQPENVTAIECPYSYIRQLYGKHHWAPFVHKLSPRLKKDDPEKYRMVLEIMDAIHLCLMLVDDVGDSCPPNALIYSFLFCLDSHRMRQ